MSLENDFLEQVNLFVVFWFLKDASAAVHVSEFMIRMIERLVIEEMAGILFIGLGTNVHFFDNLFRVIENKDKKYSVEQQRAISELIREIVLKRFIFYK